MTWTDQAKEMADAAERAHMAGDNLAMIIPATRAAQASQLARLLGDTKEGR